MDKPPYTFCWPGGQVFSPTVSILPMVASSPTSPLLRQTLIFTILNFIFSHLRQKSILFLIIYAYFFEFIQFDDLRCSWGGV